MIYNIVYLFLSLHVLLVKSHSEDVHTVQYHEDNFAEELAKKSHFVMFFAPWCGHCIRLAPTWEQLAEMLNEDESDITVAKVDCTADSTLCSAQDVTGYPTLKFFHKGSTEGVKFRGTRDLPSLSAFLNEQLRSTPGDSEGEDNKIPEIEIKSKLKELTDENFDTYVENGKYFIKFYAPWCGHCQRLAPTWEELSKTLEFEPSVGIAKIDCTLYKSVCNKFDVKGYPTLLWIEGGQRIEKYQGSRTHADLKAFVNRMMGSEKQPSEVETKEEDKVNILTGSNFKESIEKDITFVKFFAPWCGHCKRMAPAWDMLGEKFKGKSGVQIAKVDCTKEADLCNEQDVGGFPTVYLYKNGEKVTKYDGSRSLDDLYDFVLKYLPHDEL